MRTTKLILLLLLASASLSSCDFFRKIAGRPTSEQIEAKRALIESERNSHLRRLEGADSLSRSLVDSLAVLDSIQASNGTLIASRQLTDESRMSLRYRYYVVVGAFSKKENASRAADNAAKAGYEAALIQYNNGFTAVGVCPSNSIVEVCTSLRKIKESSFCPDAWVLDNK